MGWPEASKEGTPSRLGCTAKRSERAASSEHELGSPVVPFYPFCFWVPLLRPNSRKKGTLIIKGLLGNLVKDDNRQGLEWEARGSGLREAGV